MTTSEQQPQLEIQLPVVRLQLAELVSLRNVIYPPEKVCYMDGKVRDKLLMLGLVEYKKFPPCPKKKEAAVAARKEAIAWIRQRLNVAHVHEIDRELPHSIRTRWQFPTEELRLVATEAGKKIVAGYPTTVKLPKPDKKKGIPGCA